jgi:hypothetical protein
MSEILIRRRTRSVPISIGTVVDTADTLRMDDMAGAVVSVGTMATAAATYQCWGSIEPEGPYRRMYDAGGEAVDITLAPSSTDGRVYSLPDGVFAVPYVRIVSSTASATATSAVISFKS